MNLSISEEIRAACPDAALGVLQYHANVTQSSPALLETFERSIEKLATQYTMETISRNPHIAATRAAYKALGKNPHEYRNAAEAMLRRVVKGSGLYHINSIVEINNLISISSGYSIGSYTVSDLRGDLVLRRAGDGVHYAGIGKAMVNIEHLPTLFDEEGPFGNPTSDSQRAMIQTGAQEIVSILYSFDGREGLTHWMEQFAALLTQYCGAENLTVRTV